MPLIDDMLRVTLGAFRIGGLLVAMPIFGSSPVPPQVKFFFAIAFGVMLLPFHMQLPAEIMRSNDMIIMMAIKEVAVGLAMGFGARLLFLVVTMGLEFAGLQMGFAIANIFDPANNAQISVLAQFGVVLTIIYLLQINFHHDVFRILIKSYEVIPFGMPSWDFGITIDRLTGFLSECFVLAIRISMPIMIAMLTMHIIMGVISKTAPQMNLFFNVAFVINIATGLILLAMMLPRIFTILDQFSNSLMKKGFGLW